MKIRAPKTLAKIKALRKKGWSLPEIGRKFGVAHSAVYYALKGTRPKPSAAWGVVRRDRNLVQRVKANCQRWQKILTLLREME